MASMTAEEIKRADSVIWVQQTIHNACGFYALLHAVLNISSAPRRFSPGSVLDTLLKSGSREKRQAILETSQALDEAYIPIALQGQTAVAEDWTWEPPFHYICFVKVQDRVWQLDGDRRGPVDKGDGAELVDVVRRFIQERGDGALSLMVLFEAESK